MTHRILLVALFAGLAGLAHAARPTPPLAPSTVEMPAWLPPAGPFVRVDSLAAAVGHRVALDGSDGRERVFFVRDWKWVRLSDGRVLAERLEWIDDSGELIVVEAGDDPAFRGARELTTFSELLSVEVVSVTDEAGIIRHVSRAALDLGSGGETLAPGEAILGRGACWLKPNFGCPLPARECPGYIGCIPQPNGLCACVLSPEAGRILYCTLEVVSHGCVKRRCSGQCVEPCVCQVGGAGGDDGEEE